MPDIAKHWVDVVYHAKVYRNGKVYVCVSTPDRAEAEEEAVLTARIADPGEIVFIVAETITHIQTQEVDL